MTFDHKDGESKTPAHPAFHDVPEHMVGGIRLDGIGTGVGNGDTVPLLHDG